MKIGHAVMNENGSSKGGAKGDQTGKEIRIQNWYNREGGWQIYLEPVDEDLADRAVAWMERICEDDRFGYDQVNRWSGYQEIRLNGFDGASKGDFDCSSLVLTCYLLAGLNIRAYGYTGNMASILMETGCFTEYTDEEHLASPDMLRAGGILIAPGKHTCMCMENGKLITTSENDQDDELFDEVKGPRIGRIVAKGSVRVRNAPKTGTTLKILHKGEILDILTEDAETGWLYTHYGWVTNNERYVEVDYD